MLKVGHTFITPLLDEITLATPGRASIIQISLNTSIKKDGEVAHCAQVRLEID